MSIVLGIVSFILFAAFQATHIPSGDSGDLLTAAATFGVAHPPGYPLYTFIGWLLHVVPVSTIVWRIGLLSSVPHALVIVFVYTIVRQLTGRVSSALISALVLTGNYLFFLYSVTPEVFALLDLFIVLVFWLALRFSRSRKMSDFRTFCFVLGLSLTHHQVILFMLPALIFFLWPYRRWIFRHSPVALVFMALGFLPYLYVFAAGMSSSVVNWDTVTNVHQFIKLFTRADYGTFQSGSFIGSMPVQRLLQVKALGQFIWMDFRWVGILLAITGFIHLYRTRRRVGMFLFLVFLCMGPVFLMYASFPLTNRFTLATFERFLLPSYLCIALCIGSGIYSVTNTIFHTGFLQASVRKFAGISVLVLLGLFFSVMGLQTLQKFRGYRTDRTAEQLARDVLADLPNHAILLLNRDSPLFTTQFVRYALNVRPDVYVLHANKLGTRDFTITLKKIFPELIVPDGSGGSFITEFIEKNRSKHAIFGNARVKVDAGWYWIPHGLVFELVQSSRLPDIPSMMKNNERLWSSFQDPSAGILSVHNHMMLSDVSDVYTSARKEFGTILLRAGEFGSARDQFTKAIGYGGDSELAETYLLRGLSRLVLRECTGALEDFQAAKQTAIVPDKNIAAYESMTYRDCVGDPEKSAKLFEEYKKSLEHEQIPLRTL